MTCLVSAAHAEETSFCAGRTALGEPACTAPAGRVIVESSLGSWSRSNDVAGNVSDSLNIGEIVLRTGVNRAIEVHLGFSGWKSSWAGQGSVLRQSRGLRQSRTGDVELGLTRSLAGGAVPVALTSYVAIPTGHGSGGVQAWTAGGGLAVSGELPGGIEFKLEPELAWTPNAERSGRHLAWEALAGVTFPVGRDFSVETDLTFAHDADPDGHAHDARGIMSLTWAPNEDLQLAVQLEAGLTADAPRHVLSLGIARAF